MTNKKVTRRALVMSVTSLLICISMLLGTTFAWFTDEVTSGVNKIVAGNLDVELLHKSVGETDYTEVTTDTLLFKNAVGTQLLWEPGAMAYESFKVSNVGTLALKYKFNLNTYDYNTVTRGTQSYDLRGVLKFLVVDGDTVDRATLEADTGWKTWEQFSAADSFTGTLVAGTTGSEIKTVVIWWQPNDNATDNLYNLKNKTADGWTLDKQNDNKDELYISVGITLVAGQLEHEQDSFDEHYDATAEYPVITSASATATSSATGAVTLTAPISPASNQTTSVELPDSSVATEKSVKLDVEVENVVTAPDEGFAVTAGSSAIAAIDLTLTVDGAETSTFGGNNAKITTYITKELTEVVLNYNGSGDTQTYTKKTTEDDLVNAGDYYYEPDTGKLVFLTAHFSEYYVTATNEAINATKDVGYTKLYNATDGAYDKADAGDTIVLLKDVNLTSIFLIGKDITIDGKGHNINNTANRVIRVTTANTDLKIYNCGIISKSTADDDVRGISFDTASAGSTLLLDHCTVSASFYTINTVPGADNLTITINNGTVAAGWAAINSYTNNSAITINNSTLCGLNDKGENSWNNFNTITFDGNSLYSASNVGKYGSNNTVSITNSVINSSSESDNNQAWVGIQYGALGNTITVDAATRIVDDNNNDMSDNYIIGYYCNYSNGEWDYYDSSSNTINLRGQIITGLNATASEIDVTDILLEIKESDVIQYSYDSGDNTITCEVRYTYNNGEYSFVIESGELEIMEEDNDVVYKYYSDTVDKEDGSSHGIFIQLNDDNEIDFEYSFIAIYQAE